MKVFRVRIGTQTFGMASGMVPSCIVVVKKGDYQAMRASMLRQLEEAFKDDQLLTSHVKGGDFDVTEIPLDKEGIF